MKPIFIPSKLSTDPIESIAVPRDIAERVMVFLCVRREETKPEHKRDTKYPVEIRRKRDPASPWLIPSSVSMAGNKGASTILDIKFRKKMRVKKRIDFNWEKKGGNASKAEDVEEFWLDFVSSPSDLSTKGNSPRKHVHNLLK
jgi:hypothetical protein